MSAEQAVLRPTVIGSLLDIARHNLARGQEQLAIFESGTVYRRSGDGPLADEHHALGALLVGDARPAGWRDGGSPPADVYAARALVEAVLGALHVDWHAEQAQRSFLHPGKAGVIRAGDDDPGHLRRGASDRARDLGDRRSGGVPRDRHGQGRRRGARPRRPTTTSRRSPSCGRTSP